MKIWGELARVEEERKKVVSMFGGDNSDDTSTERHYYPEECEREVMRHRTSMRSWRCCRRVSVQYGAELY